MGEALRRKIGAAAMIVLIIATSARVLVKFGPAISGFFHFK
jgi:hypothetical protein